MKNADEYNCNHCPSIKKSIFCRLSHSELDEVSEHKTLNRYKKGQNLFLEGNPAYGLFCIHKGKVKLSKCSDMGKETIIKIVNAGEVLGHRSLFAKENYRATATAIEDCEICFFDKTYIERLSSLNPTLAIEIITQMSNDMGQFEDKMARFHQMNVRERFGHLLIELNNKFGAQHERGRFIDVKLTREEMASMIGTATETLIRTVTEYKDENAIALEGKKIFIINLQKVYDIANLS